MNGLAEALRELVGLFVEDGSLALGIIAVVAAAAVLSMLGIAPGAVGFVLLLGCVAVLVENILRARRNALRPPSSR
jgi:dolichol kinase